MERASDVTRSFLDLRLLPALSVAWLPPWQRHSRRFPGNQFKCPYSSRSKPRGPFMATCRAQTSLQPPLALPDTSSHCLLGFLLFLKYTIAEMKATSKLRPPHPSAERPLQGVRGSFFISKLPACRHYIIKCSMFLQFYAVLESAQKCALLRAKGLMYNCSILEQKAYRTKHMT